MDFLDFLITAWAFTMFGLAVVSLEYLSAKLEYQAEKEKELLLEKIRRQGNEIG